MTLDHPLLLAVLPVLALVVVGLERSVPASRTRRWARGTVRLVVLALLLLALAGPRREGWEDLARRLVVVRDVATRLHPSAAAERDAWARQAVARAEAAGIRTSALAFTTQCARAGEPPPRTAESIAAVGLAGARLAFREQETGGVLLLSDGHGDLGGLAETAAALRAEGLAVTAAAVPERTPVSVQPARVIALEAPAQARGPFVVRVAVESPDARPLDVALLVDGAERERRRVEARPDTELRFEELLLYPGLHEIAVVLGSAGGGQGESPYEDMARALVEVGAPPRIVALLGDAAGSPFRKALTAQGQHVAAVAPEALPAFVADARDLPDLALADAAGLAALSPDTAGLLVERVRSGLGLLVEAGGSREAWEALAESPLAAILPLVPLPEPKPPPTPPARVPEDAPEPPIDPPEPEEGPGLTAERRPEEALPITLLLVVDRSPSMEGAKLAMAIEGARRAALALSAWDRVGVITFAHESTLDVAPRSARSAGSLPLWLSTVEAGGKGTNIFGALQHASRVLAAERSPILHLILLTDGRQFPDGPIFGPVVKPMRQRGITITAVGIGRGARLDQLRDIVQWAAGGMVIPVADASQIPTVLTRDTQGVAERRNVDAQRLARLRDPEAKPQPPAPDEPEPPAPPRPRDPDTPQEPPPPTRTDVDAERLPLRRVRPHEATLGLTDDALPDVGPPRRSEPAYGAVVLLEREDGRPVLAAGRAGLGRVLVWGLPPRDVGSMAWPALGQLAGQAARAAMAPRGAFAFLPTPRVLQGSDGALLHVDWPRGETRGQVRARWSAQGASKDLGTFTPDDSDEGHPLPSAPAGTLCRLDLELLGGPALVPLSYLVRQAPSEPARAGDPQALAAALGAALTPVDAFVDALPHARRPASEPLWPFFLWAAIALLVLDVWLHRRRGAA